MSPHGTSVACSSNSQSRQCPSWNTVWQKVRLYALGELMIDAIGSVQFHPFKPLMMASAGSRAPPTETEDVDSDSSESDSENSDDDNDEEAVQDYETPMAHRPAARRTLRPTPLDDSLRIWSFA